MAVKTEREREGGGNLKINNNKSAGIQYCTYDGMMPGLGLMKWRTAPPYGPMRLGKDFILHSASVLFIINV